MFHDLLPKKCVAKVGLISLDTLKIISVKIVSEVVIRNASGHDMLIQSNQHLQHPEKDKKQP